MQEHRKLTYLAVPYSHPDPEVMIERFNAVNLAASRLIARGDIVFSPITHCHPIKTASEVVLPSTWDFWKNYDWAFLDCCKKVVVLKLDGWDKSIGVTAEIKYAIDNGLEIEYMDPIFGRI